MAVVFICLMCSSCGNTKKDNDATNVLNGHEFVDLGLPSGIKWATCNVGASFPENYGDYFAWGESKTKSTYTKMNYNSSENVDAATVNWGNGWRIPTKEEYEELVSKCSWEWTTQNGKNGYKIIGHNGNSIFLPASGARHDDDSFFAGTGLYDPGDNGGYWSSSTSSGKAVFLNFFRANVIYIDNSNRSIGMTIRPVCSGGSIASSVQEKEEKSRKSEEELKQEAEDYVLACYKNNCEYYDESIINYSDDLENARRGWRKTNSYDCDEAQSIFYDRAYDDGCGSVISIKNYKYNIEDIILTSENTIKVLVRYSFDVYDDFEGGFIETVKHQDEFTLIEENGDWVIDDLVRDGVSSKSAYRRNDTKFGRDKC